MPQQSILPDHPPMTGLTIELRAPVPGERDCTDVWVAVGYGHRSPSTVWIAGFPGVEADYLDTVVTAATTAYLYGETGRDVAKACADVKKMSRMHARRSTF